FYEGNVEIMPLIDWAELDVFVLVCTGAPGDSVDVPASDVVFNAICDADTNKDSLAAAVRAIDQLGLPVVNHPEQVLATSRDALSARFGSRSGWRVPRTVRATSDHPSDVANMVEGSQVELPVLVREVGNHGGTRLALVEELSDLRQLERFDFDGREFYLTDFVDLRSPDGLYRKYRVLVIGGVPHPKHLIASESWNVHWEDRAALMDRDPDLL